jgi:hypothetical protein
VPAEAVVRVLNKGMYRMLPKLEAIEPDLPVPMLDRMALRYSPQDILQSFLMSMVPMKPTEFTRIIIVHNGYPLNWFNPVLGGIMSARSGQCECGSYQPEIGNLLEKFLPMRSSYGPHVVNRVLMVKAAAEKTAAEVPQLPLYMPPAQPPRDLPFYDAPHMSGYNQYAHSYATMPVMYAPEEYQRRVAERPDLRKPMNPFAVGLLLGLMYATYRNAGKLKDVVNFITSDKGVLAGGLGAAALVAAATGGAKQDPIHKHAGWLMKGVVAPFVGAHLASAHYRRKYYQGEDLNGIEKFIAENPDYLSVAAPVGLYFANKKLKGGLLEPKVNIKEASEETTKMAEFSDILTNSAIQGIIFRGRGISTLGNVSDMLVDNMVMSKAIKAITPDQEKVIKKTVPNSTTQV